MFKLWKKDKKADKKEETIEELKQLEEEMLAFNSESELEMNNLEETDNQLEVNDKYSDLNTDLKEDISVENSDNISEEASINDVENVKVDEKLDDKDNIELVEEESDDKIYSSVEGNIDELIEDSVEGNLDELEEELGVDKTSLFSRLLSGLSKTKNNITVKIDRILGAYAKIDEDMLEEIEEILITADVGMNTTMEIVDQLRDLIKERCVKDPKEVMGLLREVIENVLTDSSSKLDIEPSPAIVVMVGVNGVGKTTTIGKLAQRYKEEGKKVILGAGDTFRAAASEQLEIWAKRVGVDIVKHSEGADPGAVVFDAIKASKARGADLLIVDTAGRLHNKANLMKEIGKIFKIIDREYPEAKLEVLLVVDATTGQNAVSQAKTFKEVCNITGIVLTKLDGTAKGGVVLAVESEVGVPVKLIGVGESAKDLQDFNPKAFTDALFGE